MSEALRASFKRYVLILVGVWVALLALGIVLDRLLGFAMPGGAVAIIPPMIAALSAGQAVGHATGKVPSGVPAWRFAAFASLVYLAFQLLLAVATVASLSRAGAVMDPSGLAFGAVMLGVLAAIVVLIVRLFLSIGAKSALVRRG